MLLGLSKRKTRKEEQIDRKIEQLLEVYKRQDEQLLKKAQEKENAKATNKKQLRDKFGFSDDEDDDGLSISDKNSIQAKGITTGGVYSSTSAM